MFLTSQHAAIDPDSLRISIFFSFLFQSSFLSFKL
jgi:hypothetical protein